MKNNTITKLLLVLLAITLITGCSSKSNEETEKKDDIETQTTDNNTTKPQLNTSGIKYSNKMMPDWGIYADIPDGWNATVNHEKAVVFFTSTNPQYEGIEISFKHTYNGSNVPSLLRKDFDYYYLYDFVYHGKENKNYHTTDYEPQDITIVKDESKKVWVDSEAEWYTGTDERGDPNSYYMEYDEMQEGMNMREDKKIIGVQENPRLSLMEDKSREMLKDFYVTAYYMGYAESEIAVALTVIGDKSQTKVIDDIAKTIAYSVKKINNGKRIDPIPLDGEVQFAGTTIKAPSIKSSDHLSLTDDYTATYFQTKMINTTITNDTGLSFKDFYKSDKLTEVIETEFFNKKFKLDETTKSAYISGGIVGERKVGNYDAVQISFRTETRSSKASVKELIRSKYVIHYSDIMLADLGNNKIAIFALTAPHTATTPVIGTFEEIFK